MPEHDIEKELSEFLKQHTKPYDPATDNYERPPFAADIKEGKNDPIYNAHSYHTKVPPRGIIPFILHYTQPGDLILDPFCGSGMTGVAAQMCANPPFDILEQFPELKDRVGPRACILNDLSPAACHIAYNYNTPIDVAALKLEFDRIKAVMKEEFDWLYGTEHYEPAVGLYEPNSADVASRLKNPPADSSRHMLLGGDERTWELLTQAEVEARLGYPVTDLPSDEDWGDLDVTKVNQWVCIPATIQYTIWSDVFRCEGLVNIEESTGRISTRGKNVGRPIVAKKRVARGCGDEIILWNVAMDPETGELKESVCCSKCGLEWKKNALTRVRSSPVVTNYYFNGRAGKTYRRERRVTRRELVLIESITRRQLPYWVPSADFAACRELWRRVHQDLGINKTSDFFTSRNLWALAALWESVKSCPPSLQSAIRFAITPAMWLGSKLYRYRTDGGGGEQGKMNPRSVVKEINILQLFESKQNDILRAFASYTRYENLVYVTCRDAGDPKTIPDSSVDFVFTDPPFGANLFYADLSLIWESWLDEYTDERFEAVWNLKRKPNTGGKTLEDYGRLMQAAFAQIFRVLKPKRNALVEFNNRHPQVFDVVKQVVTNVGFQIVDMRIFDKVQKTFIGIKGERGEADAVDKDVIFYLLKPDVVEAVLSPQVQDLEHHILAIVREHLKALPGRISADPATYSDEHRTTATINSILMNALIPKGFNVQQLTLPLIERVCGRYFKKTKNRWYLRGEAIGVYPSTNLLNENFVTVSDEISAVSWIRAQLQRRPLNVGQLRPLWNIATGMLPKESTQNLDLEQILLENFWLDTDSNRWREPTQHERDKINDDRSLRVLHDAERFMNQTLRRNTTDEERCEWIDQLFQACRAIEDNETDALPALRGFDKSEAYALITRLFQSILSDHVLRDVYSRAEKQARAASQRLSKSLKAEDVAKERAKAGSDVNQGVLNFKKNS